MMAPYEKSHSLPDLKELTLRLILDSYEKISYLFNVLPSQPLLMYLQDCRILVVQNQQHSDRHVYYTI